MLKESELIAMRKTGKVAAHILRRIRYILKPGISTKDIENYFDNVLKVYPGMEPAFKGFMGYPASLCVSVNDEIIHGIPSDRKIIKSGDLVSVDLGIRCNGIYVDCARTYHVGKISKLGCKLINVTLKALYQGIKQARAGAHVGNIGFAIQNFTEKHGFSVIRKFVGHGIGRQLHSHPEIPNFGVRNEGDKLEQGMVIAIEPMIASGTFEVDVLSDGWTAKTRDHSLSCHFEHTVAITKKGPWIMTN
ncbi:MAG: type I methionyl aminopeptidase [Candidatus Omnitrophota bacterium]